MLADVAVADAPAPRLSPLPPTHPEPAQPHDPAHHPVRSDRFRYDVAVVGLGYVGLPTALQFHAAGRRVLAVDINPARLADIEAEAVDLGGTDRARLAKALRDSDRFVLTGSAGSAGTTGTTGLLGSGSAGSAGTTGTAGLLGSAAAVLICVPTPIDRHLMPDLSALRAACQTVVTDAQPGQVLLLTSTTYVGCTRELLAAPLAERGLVAGRDVFVAFAPERINPGTEQVSLYDVPRVVGGVTPDCAGAATAALEGCANVLHPVSSAEVAELTKLLENTFRAVNISLVNEFADISASLNLDVNEVIDAAATKPYGFLPFRPGAGVGGHCIPCDPHYLLWQLRAERVPAPMIDAAMASVASRPLRVVRRVIECLAAAGKPVAGAEILIVGVAYKPGVSDIRESPALDFMRRLTAAGARVSFVDELVHRIPPLDGRLGGVDVSRVADPTGRHWDLVVVHTVHPGADLAWLSGQPAVLDTTYRLTGVPERHAL